MKSISYQNIMKNKKKIKLLTDKKAQMCYSQIIILIISMFAFSFLVSIPSVTAEASPWPAFNVCCEKTKINSDGIGGALCINTLEENCDTSFDSSINRTLRVTPTSCQATSFCKPGCCYDSEQGLCSENTPQKVCNGEGGIYVDDAECNIPQCSLGCCVIGTQASFVTLTRCKKMSSDYGLETNFRTDINDEATCIAIAGSQDQGACVYEVDFQRTCRFTTRGECINSGTGGNQTSGAEFFKDYLCSSPELATNCGKSKKTTCIEGKDEVYYLDTCGNPANIYDAGEYGNPAYWTKRVDKSQTCVLQDNFRNSKNCGNCDYFHGSICSDGSATYGDNVCQDLNCYNTIDGNDYKNGESWCIFDNNLIGEGKDTVGSRHFRHVCIFGEETIEPCADFRNEQCLQQDVETGGEKFTEAACRINRWPDCIDQTEEDDCLNTDRRDCYWREGYQFTGIETTNRGSSNQVFSGGGVTGNAVAPITGAFLGGGDDKEKDVGSGIQPGGGACLPDITPGLKFWESGEVETTCALGNSKCVVTYEKGVTGSKKCIDNCECLEESWRDEMNEMCVSLGDCGEYINWVGKSGGDNIDYKIGGQRQATKSGDKTFNAASTTGGFKGGLGSEKPIGIGMISNLFEKVGLATGVGLVSGAAPAAAPDPTGTTIGPDLFGWLNSPLMGSLAAVAIFAGIGYIVGGFFGGNGGEAGAAGAAVGALTYQILAHPANFPIVSGTSPIHLLGAPPMAWGIGVGVVVFILMYKKTSTEVVEFECDPWQPPIGGNDCEECNDNEFKGCSEYRCKSLGQACGIINSGTEEEACTWINPHDVNSPKIKMISVSENYIYKPDTSVRPPATGVVISPDVEAFFPLEFTIETDEPSQCKIDYNLTAGFEEMSYYFGGDSLFDYNHTETMSLPGPDAINALAPELKNDGTYTLYTRCQDANGNFNQDAYSIRFQVDPGPDTTPPKIVDTNVQSNMPVSYNTTNLNLIAYINEPAECKWSREDRRFDDMENSMSCSDSLLKVNPDGVYACAGTLTGIKGRVANDYYLRCRDVSEKLNVNTQSYKYTIIGTQPLNILSVGPNETIKGSTDTIPVELTVKTDNGYLDGQAFCYYSLTDNEDDYIMFAETDSNIHEQRQDLDTGSYTYYYKCVDLGGNAAYDSTSFSVEVDREGPNVVRVYKEGDLKIITNEESICSYSTKDCNFNIEDGIQMPYENQAVHTAEWKVNQKYYIRCKDEYDNQANPNTCSIVVNPYAVGENVMVL